MIRCTKRWGRLFFGTVTGAFSNSYDLSDKLQVVFATVPAAQGFLASVPLRALSPKTLPSSSLSQKTPVTDAKNPKPMKISSNLDRFSKLDVCPNF